MKIILFVATFVTSQILAATSGVREINLKVQKVNDVVHWMPAEVEVNPGEKVKFIAKYDLEGGFDFHGLSIPILKINAQVERHKAFETKVITISSSLKDGNYPIGCQFHPKHAPATLVVKAKTTQSELKARVDKEDRLPDQQ